MTRRGMPVSGLVETPTLELKQSLSLDNPALPLERSCTPLDCNTPPRELGPGRRFCSSYYLLEYLTSFSGFHSAAVVIRRGVGAAEFEVYRADRNADSAVFCVGARPDLRNHASDHPPEGMTLPPASRRNGEPHWSTTSAMRRH